MNIERTESVDSNATSVTLGGSKKKRVEKKQGGVDSQPIKKMKSDGS